MYYLDTDIPVELFQRVLKKKIYVDKSMLIDKFNDVIGSEDCYYCIT
ncbi:AAA family ATPase, partial [Absiella sp. AM29-15]